jgi:hypothetical protein
MSKKKTSKPSLRLLECEPTLPKIEAEGEDEIALLIRSINDMGKKAKNKTSQRPEPEPPKAA